MNDTYEICRETTAGVMLLYVTASGRRQFCCPAEWTVERAEEELLHFLARAVPVN